MLTSAFAEAIGINAVFGAFLIGLAFSQILEKLDEAHEIVYQFVMYFFAPLYLVSVGLQANFVTSFDPILVLVVLLVACIGKMLQCDAWPTCEQDAREEICSNRFCFERKGSNGDDFSYCC